MLLSMLAFGSFTGEKLVDTIIWLVIWGLIFWLLWWLIGYFGIPEPFNKVVRGVLALFAVVMLIRMLMSFAGHP